MTTGIHHITTISSDPNRTIQFYTEVLGLRLIKQTVNFDAPDTYHLYFGNELGEPGTAMTLFPFVQAGTGMRGIRQSTKIQFAIPPESLGFWVQRLVGKGVKTETIEKKFGKSGIRFYDFDGLQLELVMTDEHAGLQPWVPNEQKEITEENAIRGFFGVELSVGNKPATEEVLTELLGYELLAEDGFHTRYKNPAASHAKYLDIFEMKGWPPGKQGAGTVHHVAFRVPDDPAEVSLREKVMDFGLEPTDVIDRHYFHSVYFREPGGVLFEIATDKPGFTVDESAAELGTKLKLPPQYEQNRRLYVELLPELAINQQESESVYNFQYKFIRPQRGSSKYLFLLHSTGGDETSMIPLARRVDVKAGIISIRGNVQEHERINRFFVRISEHEYDQESLETETAKLQNFIREFFQSQRINPNNVIFLGYSNGANILVNLLLSGRGEQVSNAILLHPIIPMEHGLNLDLSEKSFFLSAGKNDPYLRTSDEPQKLREKLEQAGAAVTLFEHDSGHGITDAELDAVIDYYG